MLYAAIHSNLQERTRIDRVVAVIFQRIDDRVRDNDRPGKMHDRRHVMFGDDTTHQIFVATITFNEGRPGWHCPAMPLT